jgi:hypothetical protein
MPAPPLPTGVTLAELDGVTFLLVTAPAVFAVRDDQVAYYCAGAAWDASPAAVESAARAELATLRARLAALESRPAPALPLAAAPKPRRKAAPPPALPALDAGDAPADEPAPAPAALHPCPLCDYAARTPQGLRVHHGRRHRERVPADEPAPAEDWAWRAPAPATPLQGLELDPRDWAEPPAARFTCPVCGSQAHAPAVSDPTICIRCDAAARRSPTRAAAD